MRKTRQDYDGDDPLLTKFSAMPAAAPVSTVVHTATDDLERPKPIGGKFHQYDAHIGGIEQSIDDIRYAFLDLARVHAQHNVVSADMAADRQLREALERENVEHVKRDLQASQRDAARLTQQLEAVTCVVHAS